MHWHWRSIAIASLLLTTLAACAEGYRLVPARLNIGNVASKSFPLAATIVHDLLASEGFDDLGKAEETIALIRRDNAMPSSARRELLVRLEREYTYLNRRHDLRVVLSDYTDGIPAGLSLGYTPTSDHFVELAIYDERPGGFGTYGLSFYRRLVSALTQRYGASLHEIARPPPTDEREYRRITAQNTIAALVAWSLALVVPFLITGSLSRRILRRLEISATLKRVIFSVVNTWLVAPLPFPAAFILVIPLPNLFAFPWASAEYYTRVWPFAALSFPVTLLLCTLVSLFLFTKRNLCDEPS